MISDKCDFFWKWLLVALALDESRLKCLFLNITFHSLLSIILRSVVVHKLFHWPVRVKHGRCVTTFDWGVLLDWALVDPCNLWLCESFFIFRPCSLMSRRSFHKICDIAICYAHSFLITMKDVLGARSLLIIIFWYPFVSLILESFKDFRMWLLASVNSLINAWFAFFAENFKFCRFFDCCRLNWLSSLIRTERNKAF